MISFSLNCNSFLSVVEIKNYEKYKIIFIDIYYAVCN